MGADVARGRGARPAFNSPLRIPSSPLTPFALRGPLCKLEGLLCVTSVLSPALCTALMPLPSNMPEGPPEKLKKKCCKQYRKKGKYCKKCPLYWGQKGKRPRLHSADGAS